ncbi:5-hydroxytryptamine receptor 4-like [Clytia hemisphaerica]|uniref:5-hydroxytryptamine receptor 4-like n=1 Tax=Clytia hemisphaerica TaxID=252671 RepID=UPI0034D679E8
MSVFVLENKDFINKESTLSLVAKFYSRQNCQKEYIVFFITMASSFASTPIPPTPIPTARHHPTIYPEVLYVFIALIIPPNVLIMTVFFRNHHIRSNQANKFICSHAFLDILVGLIFIPCLLGLNAEDNLIKGGMIMYSLLVSLLILLFSTFDRYIAICKPLHYENIETDERVRNMILFAWLFPSLVVALPWIWLAKEDDSTFLKTEHRAYLGVVVFGILAILCIIISAYVRILKVGIKHLREQLMLREFEHWTRRLPMEIKFSRMFFSLSLTFFIFWVPTGYMTLTDDILLIGAPPTWLQQMNFYWVFVASFLNPVIYAIFHKRFRKCIKVMFTQGHNMSSVVHPIMDGDTSNIRKSFRKTRLSTENESL